MKLKQKCYQHTKDFALDRMISMPFLNRRLKGSTVAVGCMAILIQACNGSVAAPPVTITATGYEVFEPVISIAWIDNTQLLFAGSKSAGMDATRTSFEPTKLYIWNDTTKSVRVYAEDALEKRFCYAHGKISYRLRVDKAAGKQVMREGPIGAEKEIERRFPQQGVSSRFTCRTHSVSELVPLPPRGVVAILREGDGYIGLGPTDMKEFQTHPLNLALFPAKNNSKPIWLPIRKDEEVGGYGTGYSEYRRAYVLPPLQLIPGRGPGNWPTDEPRVVYLVSAEGQVERVSLSPTNIFRVPRLTKSGWIYGGGDFRTAGLYLYDGKKATRVEAGGIVEIEVSPDGCKAAVAIHNRYLDKGSTPVNLKIFNFCPGGK